MKTKQKMLTKPITAGFASIFYFKSVKDGISHREENVKNSIYSIKLPTLEILFINRAWYCCNRLREHFLFGFHTCYIFLIPVLWFLSSL